MKEYHPLHSWAEINNQPVLRDVIKKHTPNYFKAAPKQYHTILTYHEGGRYWLKGPLSTLDVLKLMKVKSVFFINAKGEDINEPRRRDLAAFIVKQWGFEDCFQFVKTYEANLKSPTRHELEDTFVRRI